jgi:hypothetical protein
MINRYAAVALVTTLLLAGCATDRRTVSINRTVEKQGVWVSGEYAYFRASDGDVFVLRLPNPRDQRRFVTLAPITVEPAEVCLSLRIEGGVNGEVDGTDRPFFVVSKIVAAQRIECGNLP